MRRSGGGAKFERFVEKLAAFNEVRGDLHLPRFTFNVVLMRRNVEELTRLLELAGRHGVTTVNGRHLGLGHRMKADFREEALVFYPELYDRVYEQSAELAGRLGIELNMPDKFSGKHKEEKVQFRFGECLNPWMAVYLMPNGDYRPCICLPAMGSMANHSFDEIQDSDMMRQLKQKLFRDPRNSCLNVCGEKRGVLHSVETAKILSYIKQGKEIPDNIGQCGWE